MDNFFDFVMLSRIQFAVTTLFHIIWPTLSIGLSLFLVTTEALWFNTGKEIYYRLSRFWSRIFLLNFGLGVVTGLPLQFEFGSNWAKFSIATGDLFGNILGFEAAMAFMLEAGFLGIMLFGWNRVPPGIHLFATSMVAVGASLSAFWIMVASAWMHTPAGVHLESGRVVVDSYSEAIFNPNMPWAVSHMWVASVETTLFFIGGISAWHLLRGRHRDFFFASFKLVLIGTVVVAPLQLFLGDGAGHALAETQPAKLAAIESHWKTNPPGQAASWKMLAWPNPDKQANDWAIEIPYGLSLLSTRSLTGQVKGLRDFTRKDQPPVLIPYYAFRIMVVIGSALFFLMLWTLWAWVRGQLSAERIHRQTALLWAWVAATPLGYIAVEMGWLTREVGRQPWILYGLMRTEEGATVLSVGTVAASLLAYTVILTFLLIGFLVFLARIIANGPDLTSPMPSYGEISRFRGDSSVGTEEQSGKRE
jgi:cytochrome d ubiquinol oxidase subunit I